MVGIPSLWLPILLSAIFVFIASSIIHMVLKYHWTDYQKLQDEDGVMEALRQHKIPPGNYGFPVPKDMKEMGSDEMKAKYAAGPVAFMNVLPSAPPNMGKSLGQWSVYCLITGVFVAYLTSRTLGPGADYLKVFQIAGCVAFIAYGLGEILQTVWKGQNWSTTIKFLCDALIYSLLTGGVFGWLWP